MQTQELYIDVPDNWNAVLVAFAAVKSKHTIVVLNTTDKKSAPQFRVGVVVDNGIFVEDTFSQVLKYYTFKEAFKRFEYLVHAFGLFDKSKSGQYFLHEKKP